MKQSSKLIKPSLIPILTAIMLLFIFPILLLTKAIVPTPNADFAHKLLYYSVPATIFTMLYQWIFIKVNLKKVTLISHLEEKRTEVYRIFSFCLWLTYGALITNYIFLSLTNFDMFLVINIVLVLWMINLFPFPNKVESILKK